METSALSLRARLILYAVAWAAALLAIDPRLWPLIYMFPTGLFAFIPPVQADEKWARQTRGQSVILAHSYRSAFSNW